jgi:hypothetical protein
MKKNQNYVEKTLVKQDRCYLALIFMKQSVREIWNFQWIEKWNGVMNLVVYEMRVCVFRELRFETVKIKSAGTELNRLQIISLAWCVLRLTFYMRGRLCPCIPITVYLHSKWNEHPP